MFVKPLDFEGPLRNRRVLVTGHTGFTGAWLSTWLSRIGAQVTGLALAPQTCPSLYTDAGIEHLLESRIGDITDRADVGAAFSSAEPEAVIHLAAQPIVSRAYADPAQTFATNVMGTLNVLEAARKTPSVKVVVCITTDKVYQDRQWEWGYRETDTLGGADPYSASKACAELVAASYRQTLVKPGNDMRLITARGGNIIGGGDWSDDRIVPDFVRAIRDNRPLVLRNPEAVRPWQHVVALAHGYLVIAAKALAGEDLADSYNLGPLEAEARSVRELVTTMGRSWQLPEVDSRKPEFHETHFLQLDSTLARRTLGWNPPLGFADTVGLTAEWYRRYLASKEGAGGLLVEQIDFYRALLSKQG